MSTPAPNLDTITPDLLAKVFAMPEAAAKLRALVNADAVLVLLKGAHVAFGEVQRANDDTKVVCLIGELLAQLPRHQRIDFLSRAVAVVRHAQGAMPLFSLPARTH